MKTSIALIGFMGTGKTAVGKILATKLGREFIELDSLVEQKAGKSIPEIFQQDSEIGFRELEIETVKEVADRKNAVIACGGGIVLNKINIDRLRKECIIVYLTASPAIILKRTRDEKNERPLLTAPDRASQIKELLSFRQPFYERAADIKIDTSKLNTESVAEQIMGKLRDDETSLEDGSKYLIETRKFMNVKICGLAMKVCPVRLLKVRGRVRLCDKCVCRFLCFTNS